MQVPLEAFDFALTAGRLPTMAVPSVFVSSTFYDLRYIRENIRYFISTLGYVPVLSEDGTVFYDPRKAAMNACLAEIPNCQLFVLLIGGRFGSEFADTGGSITNAEYREAVRLKIPIFALVEQGVYSDFQVYCSNRGRDEVAIDQLAFPNCDDARIFEFIHEVQAQAVNDALVPFRDFGDIETYLRQQWGGMMHSFLTSQNEEERVSDTLAVMAEMNRRIEMLSEQILKSVGSKEAQAIAEMYARLIGQEFVHDLDFIGVKVGPADVLEHETIDDCAHSFGRQFIIDENDDDYSIAGDGSITASRYRQESNTYDEARAALQGIAEKYGVDVAGIRAQQVESASLGEAK